MSDSKNSASAFINNMMDSGDDLPPMQPQSPDSAESGGGFSQEVPQLDFSESNAVFDELQSFGETGQPTRDTTTHNPSATSPVAAPTMRPLAVAPLETNSLGFTEGLPLTTADTLVGWRIEKYLGLVSASAPLDIQSADPLMEATQKLSDNAQARGATAVLSVRTQVLPDNTVLLLGTAVVGSAE